MSHQAARLRATAIIERDKGILLTAMAHGSYLLPGGKVERDETALQGVVRELREETGLIADGAWFLFEHRSHSNDHHVFLVRARGTPQPRQEVMQLGYYYPECALTLSRGTRDIIAKYTELKARHAASFAALNQLGLAKEAAASLKHNIASSFVGLDELKRKQAEQLAAFEEWAARGDWHTLHRSHYDWWMFPIDETSSYDDAYTVYAGDIAALKQDPAYVRNYMRGVELLARAWGWELNARQYVANPQPGQAWSNWPIRLYKAARSLQLFEYTEQFESLKLFAFDLLRNGETMRYGKHDLAELFTHGRARQR